MSGYGLKRIRIALAGVRLEVALCSDAALSKLEAFGAGFEPERVQEVIVVNDEMIERELELVGGSVLLPETLELIALHRAVAEILPRFNGLAVHASAIEMNGKALLFLGESGAGKSTHARLWSERFGERVNVINDDKPLLRLANGEFRVYGSPWKGKHDLGNNNSAPLCAALFIKQAKTNAVRELSGEEYWRLMPSQMFIPPAAGAALNALSLLDRIKCSGVKLLVLECTDKTSAAELACRAVFGELPDER